MITRFGQTITRASKHAPISDFVAMDGGAFYAGPALKDDLICYLASLIDHEDTDFALTPLLHDTNMFYADIDKPDAAFDLDTFIDVVVNSINSKLIAAGISAGMI